MYAKLKEIIDKYLGTKDSVKITIEIMIVDGNVRTYTIDENRRTKIK